MTALWVLLIAAGACYALWIHFLAVMALSRAKKEAKLTGTARALGMPLAERQARHQEMLDCITRQDVNWWSQTFMEALAEQEPDPTSQPRLVQAGGG